MSVARAIIGISDGELRQRQASRREAVVRGIVGDRQTRERQRIDSVLEDMPMIIDDTNPEPTPEPVTGQLPDPPTFSGEGDFAGALASLFQGSAPIVIPAQPAPAARPLPWTALLVMALVAIGGFWLWRKYGK